MERNVISEINNGLQTAFLNRNTDSNLAYRPQFITNDHKRGIKVLTHIENQLMHCDEFSISVAFISRSGFVELSETLKELERRGIKGRILTTDYLHFSDPYALDRLAELKNVELKMYHVDDDGVGFHTKGYLFRKSGIYRIIIGSSNMTQTALSTNMEWNTQLVSTEQGEMAQSIVREFEILWMNKASYSYEEVSEVYRKEYKRKKQIDKLVREQQKIALQEDIIDYDAYKLKPNKMQEEFICSVQDLIERGAKKALLISATGTGKTYASAFAMKYFLEHGYRVDAVDESAKLCRIASEFTGIQVHQMLFQELQEKEMYDGIWACASVLHVPKIELANILQKMCNAVKVGGIIYTSFKYGNFEGERSGRFFCDFTEKVSANL